MGLYDKPVRIYVNLRWSTLTWLMRLCVANAGWLSATICTS